LTSDWAIATVASASLMPADAATRRARVTGEAVTNATLTKRKTAPAPGVCP
jgi:hypothetical protein